VNRVFEANLDALQARADRGSRELARTLGPRGPAPDLGLRNRQGAALAGWVCQGRPRALVSTYDALTEADRWSQGWPGGTAVVFGGAGVAAAQGLADRGLKLAFWVEPRIEVWQSLLTYEDWTAWLVRDEWVPVAGSPDDWVAILKDRYHPLWDGALKSFDWRAAAIPGQDLWDGYRKATVRGLDELASDGSTQARFGERWYRNTLINLRNLKAAEIAGCTGRVVVAGAGPSLEDALTEPANRRWLESRSLTGDRLFAVDTAFPALAVRGIVPDVVFSLDGQLATYHHFVPRDLPKAPLVADLAALPLLGRLGLPVVRYLSGHPFGAVIRRWFPELPQLDGSLGNVSGIARTTAAGLGARSVDCWGVDFGYREGQAYARGTYVYDLAQLRAGRLTPIETRLTAAAYGAAGVERNVRGHQRWDTTPLLRDYRRRWEAPARPVAPVRLAHGSAQDRWDRFAEDWRHRLETLPFPAHGPFHSFVRRLAPDLREDWLALWPLALALYRVGVRDQDLLHETRTRALRFLQD